MADRVIATNEALSTEVDEKLVMLTPDQLIIIAKKLNIRSSRLNRSHLKVLREVGDTIEKLCDESEETKTNILQKLVYDLNELLDISNDKVSDDLGETEQSGSEKVNESAEKKSSSDSEKSNGDEEEGEKTKSADGENVGKIAGVTENDDVQKVTDVETKTSVETEEVFETIEENNGIVKNGAPTSDGESKVDENGVDSEETGNVFKIIEVEEDGVKHLTLDDDDIHMKIENMNQKGSEKQNRPAKKNEIEDKKKDDTTRKKKDTEDRTTRKESGIEKEKTL